MIVDIEKNILSEASSICEKAISQRSTIPMFQHFLIESKIESTESYLKIIGYDQEIGIQALIPAKIESEGSFLISAKNFTGIISKLENHPVKLVYQNNGQLEILSLGVRFQLHALPGEEYPALPTLVPTHTFKIPAQALKNAIRKTLFAVSGDENKLVLSGVLFDFNQGVLKWVATDGYRLSLSRIMDFESSNSQAFKAIIPVRVLNEILKMIGEYNENIVLNFSKDSVDFSIKSTYFYSKLIPGLFPDYQQVIPKDESKKVFLKRDLLLAACERSMVIASNASNILQFELKDQMLILKSQSQEIGVFVEQIEIENELKIQTETAFNVRLILDILRSTSAEWIEFSLSGPLLPGLLRVKGNENDLYVVMPIRTI